MNVSEILNPFRVVGEGNLFLRFQFSPIYGVTSSLQLDGYINTPKVLYEMRKEVRPHLYDCVNNNVCKVHRRKCKVGEEK